MSDNTSPSSWRQFLSRAGAVYENGYVMHFGGPDDERKAVASTDILVDLSHLSLWRISGNDAENFLQGQLSNDIRQVKTDHAQLSAYCSPKGRMFAIFLIVRRGDAYFLQLPASLADSTFKRLRMFVLRSRVTIEPADSELVHTGISGPNAESLVREIMGSVPSTPFGCVENGEVTAIGLAGPQPRFELLAPPARMMEVWNSLAPHTKPVGAQNWSWLDILAGIPSVLPGTVEEFVPQMTNLELIGGVNFKKGCYPGQEIVARMHYLGHLKQRMVRGRVHSDTVPSPGSAVYSPNFPGQAAGHIVDAQRSPSNGVDLLVVAQVASIKKGELRLNKEDGPPISIESLPYSVPID